jgi:hypothetical protein
MQGVVALTTRALYSFTSQPSITLYARSKSGHSMQRRSERLAAVLNKNSSIITSVANVSKEQNLPPQRRSSVSSQLPPASECTATTTLHHLLCSNCKTLPVAAVTNCFSDWCQQCDAAVWATRPSATTLHHPLCDNCKEFPVAAVTNCFSDWCQKCDAGVWATRPLTPPLAVTPSSESDSPSPVGGEVTDAGDLQGRGTSHTHSLFCFSTSSPTPEQKKKGDSCLAGPAHMSVSDVRFKHSESFLSIAESCDTDVNVNSSRSFSQSVDLTRENMGSNPRLDNHVFFRNADFVTVGQPTVKTHRFTAGLTELQFENCVVKVRTGHDLNELIRCSSTGSVALRNVSANGWAPNTQLPSFIFVKYMSSLSMYSAV